AVKERLPLNELTILGNKNIKNMFSYINELWIGGRSLETPFISVITNICHNVETMIVSFEPFDLFLPRDVPPENISKLISSQKNLKLFTLISYKGTSYSFLNSLETQSHSLERVHIRSTFFKSGGPNLSGIAECKLLKAIVIDECENVTLELVKPLMNAGLYMLTYVYFYCPYGPIFNDEFTQWANSYDNGGKKMYYRYKGEKTNSKFNN
ncbi:10316_t:CDS:2, partial [Dentiscutata erythropus]